MPIAIFLTTFFKTNVVLAVEPIAWSGKCVSSLDANVATIQGLECLFKNVVSILVPFAGLAIFVWFLIGGFKYLTAGGDPKGQEQAKNTMTYALLGLITIIAAYLILNFLSIFTSIPNLLNFTIPLI